MFSDTAEFRPPSPSFREDRPASTSGKYLLSEDGNHLHAKRKNSSGSLLNVSITRVLSFHSKSSRHGASEEDTGSKNSVYGKHYSRNRKLFGGSTPSFHPNGASPVSTASFSSETKSFLNRVSAAFRRPPLAPQVAQEERAVPSSPDVTRTHPAKGLTLVIPQSRVSLGLATSPPNIKEDYFARDADVVALERERFTNFRFGRVTNNSYPRLDDALPSPSDGLFESSAASSMSWTQEIHSSSLWFDPENQSPLPALSDSAHDHIYPLPAALTPLLIPIHEPSSEPAIPPEALLPSSPMSEVPTPLRERKNRLTLIPVGVQPPGFEECLLSPSLTRSRSPSMSDDDSTISTPTLLESALCLSGCTLKHSTSPKTWAVGDCIHRRSVIVERPIEKGIWGVTDLSPDHIIVPLSAAIVFDEPVEMVSPDTDDSHDNLSMMLIDVQREVNFGNGRIFSSRPHRVTRSQTIPLLRPESVKAGSVPRRTLSLTIHDHTSRLRRMKEREADVNRSVTLVHA